MTKKPFSPKEKGFCIFTRSTYANLFTKTESFDFKFEALFL
jgi:hypothetical protein